MCLLRINFIKEMLPFRVGLRDVLEWDVGVLLLLVLLHFIWMCRKRAYEKHDDEKKDFEEGVKVASG